jgi:hypothetical protein
VISEHTSLIFDIELDYSLSLDFTDDHGVVFTAFIAGYGDDEPQEVETRLERLIDETIELNKFDGDYQQLYCIAHELDRCSERLREVAGQMEDSTQIEDLFDVDLDDLPEVDDDSTTYRH